MYTRFRGGGGSWGGDVFEHPVWCVCATQNEQLIIYLSIKSREKGGGGGVQADEVGSPA